MSHQMKCSELKGLSTAYLDGKLAPGDAARLRSHLNACDDCIATFEQYRSMRSSMLEMERPKMPALLSTRLRIIASKERSQLVQAGTSRWARWQLRWRLRIEDFMRPLTIPAAGGLISSFALFGILAASFVRLPQTVAYATGYDIPIHYDDVAAANLIPVDMKSSFVVTMSLDGKGQIQDYALRDGRLSFAGGGGHLSSGNIAMPQFPTVLTDSKPITGDVSISVTPLLFRQ